MTTMTAQTASGTFKVSSMEEDTYQVLEHGGKLTRARGDQQFEGDIQGTGRVEWLMCYRSDGTARFVGHQLMKCSIGERTGTFVIEADGEFTGSTSKGDWRIVPGTGTGDLTGIDGDGGFAAEHGPDATYHLNLTLT